MRLAFVGVLQSGDPHEVGEMTDARVRKGWEMAGARRDLRPLVDMRHTYHKIDHAGLPATTNSQHSEIGQIKALTSG